MSFARIRSRNRFASIRTRLTLWSALITTCVSLMLCGILYIGIVHSLQSEIDGFLKGEVHEMAARLERHAGDHKAVQASFSQELGQRARESLVFRLKDAAGRVLVSSDPAAAEWAAARPAEDWKHRLGEAFFATIHVPGYVYAFRACGSPFSADDGHLYVAEALYPLDRMLASLAIFRIVAVLSVCMAAVASVIGGVLVAGRCLHPIQTITAKANAIGTQAIQEGLPLRGTGDELDQLATTLNGMLSRLENHVRQVRQFTADASHELRSPLAVLRGNAEVVLSRPRSANELRAVIEQSVEHYDRLTRIAEDLLLLARADTGSLPFRREPVDLAAAVHSVVDLYGPLAEERGVRLRTEVPGSVCVLGDHTYLRQLIGNVMDNAFKYLGQGKNVSVELAGDNSEATVIVRDDGPGIPAQDLPHVFDRFYRVDRSRSASGPRGTGLGLPISRMIAEAHGGSISVTSAREPGTTVTIRLPARAD